MLRRTNFQLARVFGIRIGVGISWFVVLFLFIIIVTPYFHEVLGGSNTTAYLVSVASVLSFFVSVILHELGHALVARRNGLKVLGIDLWAFGGITRASEPDSPMTELRVAAAGPVVTIAVIALCILASRLLAGHGSFFKVATGSGSVHAAPVLVWLSWVATINLVVLGVQPHPRVSLGRGAHRPMRSSGGVAATATKRRTQSGGRDRRSRSRSARSECGNSRPAAHSGW